MAATTPRKKKNVKDLIRGAKLRLETAAVCIRPDLVNEYETIQARIVQAKEGVDSLAGAPELPELTGRLEELRAEIEESTIEFKIRGLPSKQYTQLAAKYPPRQGNRADVLAGGVNVDEIVEELIKLGTEDPVLDEEDWQLLLGGAMNNHGYQQLTTAAWAANNLGVSAPF